jgi:Mrp family chromosome partitioning ATPase
MSMKEKKGSFIFASAYAHDGALQILSGLAGYLSADLNKKVLVVDLNVRAPLLHKALGLPESNDLLDIVEVRTGVEREARSVGPNLQAVTSGSAVIHLRGIKRLVAFLSRKPLFTGPSFNPVSLLESPKTADFIKQAKARYDLVLCACSPIAEAKDALICAGLCDSVIFVVSEGLTRRQSARHALELLKARSASLVGFVLTNRTMSIPKAIYHRL